MNKQDDLLQVLKDIHTIAIHVSHPTNDANRDKARENIEERIQDIEYLDDEVKYQLDRLVICAMTINARWHAFEQKYQSLKDGMR